MKILLSILCGLIFGLGLILSGMSDPAKVLGFLDLAGAWNPALMAVMGGAILIAAPAYYWIEQHRGRTMLNERLELPPKRGVTVRLMLGGVLFGVGWGLAGYCPGPALVNLSTGQWQAVVFVGSMLLGMAAADLQVLARWLR